MIKQIYQLPQLSFGNKDIFSGKILSLIEAYGFNYDFARFFMQGESLLISKLDGDFVIAECGDNACEKQIHFEELGVFLQMQGFYTILCSTFIETGLKPYLKADYHRNNLMEYKLADDFPLDNVSENPPLSEVFKVLCDAFDRINEDMWESWYLDMSHRVRHKISTIYMLDKTSTVTIQFENDEIAFAGQIATLTAEQGKGYSRKLLHFVFHKYVAKGKSVLVTCKNEKLGFYEKTGFVKIGEITVVVK